MFKYIVLLYEIMKTAEFSFELPKCLIAQYPNLERSSCRLLLLNRITGKIKHRNFLDLTKELMPGDLLVFNNTRVIPAKLYGRIISNRKKIEIFIVQIINDYMALAYINNFKSVKLNSDLLLGNDENIRISVIDIQNNGLFSISFNENGEDILKILNSIGRIPIPPYLKRVDEEIDYELYQTVYGLHVGSIAAPTAGLHFDNFLLNILRVMGINFAFITLHIGLATFQPVRVNMIEDHVMHAEYAEVPCQTVEAILKCRKNGNRVVAVGTTVVKSLETAAIFSKGNDIIEPFFGYTHTFIFPGYNFRIVDALITNFHLPRSTLIMLVSAFSSCDYILNAYRVAIARGYKFFSYGDAMFISDYFRNI